jgi:hypothetical protein
MGGGRDRRLVTWRRGTVIEQRVIGVHMAVNKGISQHATLARA